MNIAVIMIRFTYAKYYNYVFHFLCFDHVFVTYSTVDFKD